MPIRTQFDTGVYQGFNRGGGTSLADVFGAVRTVQGMIQNARQMRQQEKLSEDDAFLDEVYARNFSDWDGRDPNEFQQRNKRAMMEIQKSRPQVYKKALGISGTLEDAMQGRITYDTDIDERIIQNENARVQLENNKLLFNENFLKQTRMKQDIIGQEFALVADGKQSFNNAIQRIKAQGIDANLPTEEQFNQDPGRFYNYLVAQKLKNDEAETQFNLRQKELGIEKSEKELEWFDRLQQATVNQKNRANIPKIDFGSGIDPGTGRPYTQQQNKTAAFALTMGRGIENIDRLVEANFDEADFTNQVLNTFRKKRVLSRLDFLNIAKTPEQRQYLQAQLDFMIPHLRDQSGAVINADEYSTEAMQYFPITGDDEQTVRQKRAARKQEFIAKRTIGGNRYIEMIKAYEEEVEKENKKDSDLLDELFPEQ